MFYADCLTRSTRCPKHSTNTPAPRRLRDLHALEFEEMQVLGEDGGSDILGAGGDENILGGDVNFAAFYSKRIARAGGMAAARAAGSQAASNAAGMIHKGVEAITPTG